MIIEAENYELLLEYMLLNNYQQSPVLPYFENKIKLNVTTDRNTQDLFSEELPIIMVENIESDMQNGIYWIQKLSADDKKIIKKNNLEQITLKKITKLLTPKLESELDFKSMLQDYTSYYSIIEEEYLYKLGDGYREKEEFKPLLFMFGINDLSKFYKKITDDEMQLILSLIFSKALKVGNQSLSQKIMNIDKAIKTSNGIVNQKNIWGINILK